MLSVVFGFKSCRVSCFPLTRMKAIAGTSTGSDSSHSTAPTTNPEKKRRLASETLKRSTMTTTLIFSGSEATTDVADQFIQGVIDKLTKEAEKGEELMAKILDHLQVHWKWEEIVRLLNSAVTIAGEEKTKHYRRSKTAQQNAQQQLSKSKALRIYTFGLKGMNLLGRADQLTSRLVNQRLRQRCQLQGIAAHIDARWFRDPNYRKVCLHTGYHPMIIHNVVNHSYFQHWLRCVHEKVMALFSDTDDLSISIFCVSGRHRSVSAALILDEIARRHDWRCQVVHLNPDVDEHTRQCASCQCKTDADVHLKATAMANVFDVWNSFSSAKYASDLTLKERQQRCLVGLRHLQSRAVSLAASWDYNTGFTAYSEDDADLLKYWWSWNLHRELQELEASSNDSQLQTLSGCQLQTLQQRFTTCCLLYSKPNCFLCCENCSCSQWNDCS